MFIVIGAVILSTISSVKGDDLDGYHLFCIVLGLVYDSYSFSARVYRIGEMLSLDFEFRN